MDFPAHFLWALALFQRYSWVFQGVFFSLLPDIIWSIPAIYFYLSSGRKSNYDKLYPKIKPIYQWSHSIVLPTLGFVVIWLWTKTFYWPLLAGYFLHILMDLPFHKGGYANGIAPLYPISNKKINGWFWWREVLREKPYLAILNYLIALTILLIQIK